MKSGSTRIRIAATAAFAVLAIVAAPTTALGHDKKYTTVTTVVAKNSNIVEGQIASVPRCIPARTVSISNATGTLVARVTSDAAGNWQAKVKLDQGATYTAVVSPKRIRKTRKHKHVCKSSTSTFVGV